jgi:hypothetical protein
MRGWYTLEMMTKEIKDLILLFEIDSSKIVYYNFPKYICLYYKGLEKEYEDFTQTPENMNICLLDFLENVIYPSMSIEEQNKILTKQL